MDPQEAYEEIMSGKRVLTGNDRFKVAIVIRRELILKRGIRTPEQILDDLRTEKMSEQVRNRLNGSAPEIKKESMEDHNFYHDKSSLYSEEPNVDF